MWHAYEDVFCVFWLVMSPLWLPPWSAFFFLHASMLWFVKPQFVQCLSVFPILLCVFTSTTCWTLYGIDSALLTFAIVIPSSHSITALLCYSSVDYFNLAIAILRYDCKLTISIIVKKLFMVGTYKPWVNFWICSY